MFSGAVMAGFVCADEFFADGDLDGVANHGDLDLSSFEFGSDAVGLPRERHVARRVDLACHRGRCRCRPRRAWFWFGFDDAPAEAFGLLGFRMPAGVCFDQHTPMVNMDQPVRNSEFDLFTGKPNPGPVADRSETDQASTVDLAGHDPLTSSSRFWCVVEADPINRL